MRKKDLKEGYTTGASATAGSCLALSILLGKDVENMVEIVGVKENKIVIPIKHKKRVNNWARCSVIKNAGDDPDVTDGIEIVSKVKIVKELPKISKGHYIEDRIVVVGGYGVGVVTKKGLNAEVGKSAINKGPLEMLKKNLLPLLEGKDIKVVVIIYTPQGKEVAKKTFNRKLGVLGGISILGTTGVVKPMSEEALKDSLYIELKVVRENLNSESVVITFGNHGKQFCIDRGISEERVVIASNYIGFMIESAMELGFKKIMLIGHIGKAIKVAGGIFNTHSRVADGRAEILATNAFLVGEKPENILKIINSSTTEEACEFIEKRKKLFNLIANKIKRRAEEYTRGEIEFSSAIFNYQGEILGTSDGFYKILEEFKK